MPETVCLTLDEAAFAFFPCSDSDVVDLTHLLWVGGLANNVKLLHHPILLTSWPSGRRYRRKHQVGELNEISFQRTWVLNGYTLADWKPDASVRLALYITWQDDVLPVWHQRVYMGVTGEEHDLDSQGVVEFVNSQKFTAEYYSESSGSSVPLPVGVPPSPDWPPNFDVDNFEFVQNSPLSIWTINHNLGRYPAVTIYDVNGNGVGAAYMYTSLNQIVIMFNAPFAGRAELT